MKSLVCIWLLYFCLHNFNDIVITYEPAGLHRLGLADHRTLRHFKDVRVGDGMQHNPRLATSAKCD